METILVKIDAASIKQNKDRGSTQTRIRTGKTAKFKARVMPDFFINDENYVITSWQENNGVKSNIEGEIISDELIEKCFNEKPEGIEVTIDFHSDVINHAPIPKYSFTYENMEVICCECGEKIMTDDLKSDESEDSEYYSDKICPKCGEFDCCSLKYENIDDAVKRAAL